MGKGTIADVCRDLQINRQQFNKYLSGAVFPAPATLEKMALYFGIDQIALFQSREALRTSFEVRKQARIQGLGIFSETAVIEQLGLAATQSAASPLQEGIYYVYYPWLFDPTQLVRSVMVIFKKEGLSYFRRYTRLQTSSSAKLRQYPRGCHEGLIFRQDRNVCLLGRNIIGHGEISLQTFAIETFRSENAMTGLSLVITPWGEYCALRTTVSYFGPRSSFREALKMAKIGPLHKEAVPTLVAQSVTAPLTSRIPQLRPFNLDEWLRLAGVETDASVDLDNSNKP